MAKTLKVLDLKGYKLLRELEQKARYIPISATTIIERSDEAITKARYKALPDHDALVDANNEVRGRATSHTYSASDIEQLAMDAEDRLARDHITVANRPGTVIHATSGVPTSKSYARSAHHAIATVAVLKRTTVAWVLVKVEKTERWTGPGGDEEVDTIISEAAKQDIIKHALKSYRVVREPVSPLVTA